jgi:hypothetical protein
VVFVSSAGAVLLRYGGLSVLDASGRRVPAALKLSDGRVLVRVWDRGARYPLRIDPFIQQGTKLTGSGETASSGFGWSVALSADGNTALIGGPDTNNSGHGAAWVFTRSGSTWTQQGKKLTGGGENDSVGGGGAFGDSVALSANGDTALIGGPDDNGGVSGVGAAWVFTRSGSHWRQQGPKLTGAGEEAFPGDLSNFGSGVALSAAGNTALIGGLDSNGPGVAWVFTRSGSSWTQPRSTVSYC